MDEWPQIGQLKASNGAAYEKDKLKEVETAHRQQSAGSSKLKRVGLNLHSRQAEGCRFELACGAFMMVENLIVSIGRPAVSTSMRSHNERKEAPIHSLASIFPTRGQSLQVFAHSTTDRRDKLSDNKMDHWRAREPRSRFGNLGQTLSPQEQDSASIRSIRFSISVSGSRDCAT